MEVRLLWNRATFLLEPIGDAPSGREPNLRERLLGLVERSVGGLTDNELACELYASEWDEADDNARKKLRARVRSMGADLVKRGQLARSGGRGEGNAPERWTRVPDGEHDPRLRTSDDGRTSVGHGGRRRRRRRTPVCGRRVKVGRRSGSLALFGHRSRGVGRPHTLEVGAAYTRTNAVAVVSNNQRFGCPTASTVASNALLSRTSRTRSRSSGPVTPSTASRSQRRSEHMECANSEPQPERAPAGCRRPAVSAVPRRRCVPPSPVRNDRRTNAPDPRGED